MQQCIQLSRTNGRGLTFHMVRRIRNSDIVKNFVYLIHFNLFIEGLLVI